MKVVSKVFTNEFSRIADEINKELGKLYTKYPSGDLVDIKYRIDKDDYHWALIIFETEKQEINPLILNQLIESLKE